MKDHDFECRGYKNIEGFVLRFPWQRILSKVCLGKAMVFPVVMYGCESWTVKSAEELMLLNCGVGEDS